jgi:hypothetical protein
MQNSGKEIPKWLTSNVTNVEAAIAAAANLIREQYVSVMTHQAEWDQVANGFKRPGHEGTREIAAAKVDACRSQGAELRELYAAAMG